MPLYIRDPEVDILAEKVRTALGARTKTDAVRAALEAALTQAVAQQDFDLRNAKAMALADSLGAPNPAFDMKAFTDEMWGNI